MPIAIVHCPRCRVWGLGELDRLEVGCGDLEDGQVGAGIGADDDRRIYLALVGGDPDLLGVADDVFVGQDVAVGIDDEPGADRARGAIENPSSFSRLSELLRTASSLSVEETDAEIATTEGVTLRATAAN